MKNKEYTNYWIDDFPLKKVERYNRKFKRRFEKTIKHRQQVDFIRPFLTPDTYWCDCPIGSGRLMDELHTSRMVGIDKSPAFLEYNRMKGRECFEGDLYNLPFENEFDVVTSLHTIFAFDDYIDILKQYMKILRPRGYLIIDIVNKCHVEAQGSLEEYPYRSYMYREEIEAFFTNLGHSVICIEPHDFWDSIRIDNWKNNGGEFSRKFKRRIWKFLQSIYKIFNLHFLFCWIEKRFSEKHFCKYLVVVQKGASL